MPAVDTPTVDIAKQEGVTIRTIDDVPKHKSADNTRDIDTALQIIADAWEDYQNRWGISRSKWVPVKYIRPKEFVESADGDAGDVILFKMISRKRFNTTPDGERRPWKPQIREQKDNPDDSTEIISIYGAKRENLVEFQVYSRHSRRANELVMMFDEFIHAYTWYFLERGVNRIYFEDRIEDKVDEIGATEFSVRTLRYMIVTEMLYREIDKKLQTITLRYDVGSKMKTEVLNESTGLQEHSIDRGQSD